jgi:hypothetical protein
VGCGFDRFRGVHGDFVACLLRDGRWMMDGGELSGRWLWWNTRDLWFWAEGVMEVSGFGGLSPWV